VRNIRYERGTAWPHTSRDGNGRGTFLGGRALTFRDAERGDTRVSTAVAQARNCAESSDAHIVELLCGRSNGLEALAQLGFHRLEGVDLSSRLLTQYKGFGMCYVADCRQLPFADHSKDILIVQGGLHHLSFLPGDLEQVLSEVRRVLRKSGRFVVVEPWLTGLSPIRAHIV
jgi:SAM-dependent methyltransferase